MTDINGTRLKAEADAAFARYVSTAGMGGTREQRDWAWRQYVHAETKLQAAETPRGKAKAA